MRHVNDDEIGRLGGGRPKKPLGQSASFNSRCMKEREHGRDGTMAAASSSRGSAGCSTTPRLPLETMRLATKSVKISS
jgi:hypothetical protein